jgi:hypothetical protein
MRELMERSIRRQREPIGTKGKIVDLTLKRTGLIPSGDSSGCIR